MRNWPVVKLILVGYLTSFRFGVCLKILFRGGGKG